MWSKSKSSSNISNKKEGERERALSDAGETAPPVASSSSAPHTFQVTSKDSVPVHPKPEPPGMITHSITQSCTLTHTHEHTHNAHALHTRHTHVLHARINSSHTDHTRITQRILTLTHAIWTQSRTRLQPLTRSPTTLYSNHSHIHKQSNTQTQPGNTPHTRTRSVHKVSFIHVSLVIRN